MRAPRLLRGLTSLKFTIIMHQPLVSCDVILWKKEKCECLASSEKFRKTIMNHQSGRSHSALAVLSSSHVLL